jgi:hypothetical protein
MREQYSATRRIARWLGVAALVAAPVLFGSTRAYETYHDPANQFTGNCATCHSGFIQRGPLHDLHQGSNEFTNNCNLCHTSSARDNPIIMWSAESDAEGPGYGCAGCHGRNYGETIETDINNGNGTWPTAGAPKLSGYGLRKQHANEGVTECAACHDDVSQSFIKPENEDPQYYSRSDVDITDACNTDGTEDTDQNEPNGNDTLGLDNDGDTTAALDRTDGNDTDCMFNGAGPGESSAPDVRMLLVTTHDSANELLAFTYGVGCLNSDTTIEFGALADVATYGYSGQVCNIGVDGFYEWAYTGTPDSMFFLPAGNDGVIEGSYGQGNDEGVPTERPEDTVSASCPLSQTLTDRCD